MMTIILFISGQSGSAPHNFTIQGPHDFDTGQYIGTVRGASSSFNWLIGADINGSTATDTMTITWQ